MKFNLADNIKFSKVSGDNNKIHIENDYAKKLSIDDKIFMNSGAEIKSANDIEISLFPWS